MYLLEFINSIDDDYDRVLGFCTCKVYEEVPERVKLAKDLQSTCVRSLLYEAS